MKTKTLWLIAGLAAVLTTACSGQPYLAEMRRVADVVAANVKDYSLEIPVIPEHIVFSAPVSTVQLESSYAFKISISGELRDLPIKSLVEAIMAAKPQNIESVKGDFRWGILVIGTRGERALILAVDRRSSLLKYNNQTYRIGEEVEQWLKTHIDPLISSALLKGKGG